MRGLLVGRFQPFHSGHLALVRSVREAHPDRELLIVIGSAEESFTWENPFTAGERFEMIVRALREDGLAHVAVVPVSDIRRHAMWVAYLVGLLPPFETVYTNNPLTRLLFERARFAVESPPLVERGRFEGATIRTKLADGADVSDLLPPSVAAYLREIGARERLAMLASGRPVRPPAGG